MLLRSTRSPLRSRHGFTLVEVLIAAGVLAVLMVGFFGSLRVADLSVRYTADGREVEDWVARHVAQLSAHRSAPASATAVVSADGNFTPSGHPAVGATVTDSISSLTAVTGIHGLYRITSTLSYRTPLDQTATYTLSALAHYPN